MVDGGENAVTGYHGIQNSRDEQPQAASDKVKNPHDMIIVSPNREEEFFHLAACILVVIESDQILSRINKRGCDILGYKAEEILGKNWFDTVLPEEKRQEAKSTFSRLMTGDIPPIEFYENPILNKGGRERLIRWHNTILRNREGRIVGAISSGEDITEQRRMEEALRESERNAFVLLNATSDAVILLDTSDRIILMANEQFARRFNTTVKETLGRKIEDYVSSDVYQKRAQYGDIVLKTGRPLSFIDQRDGFWIESHYYPIKDDHGHVVRLAIFSQDITERYKAEQLLKEREEELRRRTVELQESNTALRVVLKNIEEEKNRLGETIKTNLHDSVLPYVEKLKKGRNSSWHLKCLDMLEANLKNILSPFLKEMSWQHKSLTPAEMQIANLIREGKTSKEIADLLHVGTGTINTHRNHVRKKLGLNYGKVNLRSFLRSVSR